MGKDALYNVIGQRYNVSRKADPYIAERLFRLLQPEAGGHYLDIGCGTGNYTIALSEKGVNITGVDPSETMLDKARSGNSNCHWLTGTADNIPVADTAFYGAVATLTIHHWPDLEKGMAELSRVLRANGRLVIFTSDPEQMKGYWLNHYFPQMLRMACEQMPSLKDIANALVAAGFRITASEFYHVQDDLQDLFLYSGKNRPDLYFNPDIRQGISSFAAIANAAEVASGLSLLRADIDSGNFRNVQQQYENDNGDYFFIVARKTGAV